MKVWILTTEFPPDHGKGIATYCVHTARMLAEQGHEVVVLIRDQDLPAGSMERREEDGIPVARFHRRDKLHRYLGFFAAQSLDYAEAVQELIESEGAPDLIECQDYLAIGAHLLQRRASLWPGLQKTPIVITLHSPKCVMDTYMEAPTYRLPEYWVGEMERFAIRAADAVISPSQYVLDVLPRHMETSGLRSFVVPHPFEPAIAAGAAEEEERGITLQREDVVFFGRLQVLKGVLHVLSHFARRWQLGTQTPLSLIGGDTLYHPKNTPMSALIQRRYGEFVDKGLLKIEGLLDPPALRRRLLRAHVVIVASLFETFSYSVLEAMALGKVVLASRSGGQRELIEDGRTGFLFDHEDPADFDRQLDRILVLGRAEIERIGRAAKEAAGAHFSPAQVAAVKLPLLERIAAEGPARREHFPVIRHLDRSEPPREEVAGQRDLLSVVVPFHNLGATVQETVQSILASDYSPLEVVIVDDGSDDLDSISVLQDLECDDRVSVVHQENQGLPIARNTGLTASRGEFVAVLDADDRVRKDYYSWAVRILRRYPEVGFVGAWAECFGAQEGVWPTWNPEPPYLLVHNTMNSSALIYRRRDLEQFGLNDGVMEHGQEDYESVVNLVAHGVRGVAIPELLFQYRIREDSVSKQYSTFSQQLMYQRLADKHAGFYRRYAEEVNHLLNQNGPGYTFDNPSYPPPPIGHEAIAHAEKRLDVLQLGVVLSGYLDLLARGNVLVQLLGMKGLRRSIGRTLAALGEGGWLDAAGPEDVVVARVVEFLSDAGSWRGLKGALGLRQRRRRARRLQRELDLQRR